MINQSSHSKKQKKNDKSVKIFGLNLFSSTEDELLKSLTSTLNISSNLSYINTPNPEQVVQAADSTEFYQDLVKADISIPDGVGLVIASRLFAWLGLSTALPRKFAGVDLVSRIIGLANESDAPVLVIGGREYASLSSASRAVRFETESGSVFWHPGYEQVSAPTQSEEEAVQKVIAEVQPSVIFVAFGAPHQERWVVSHLQYLENQEVRIVMVVGGSFDYLLGRVARPARWIQAIGMEWLYRLVVQPWRWRRQLRLVSFVGLVIRMAWSGEVRELPG